MTETEQNGLFEINSVDLHGVTSLNLKCGTGHEGHVVVKCGSGHGGHVVVKCDTGHIGHVVVKRER